MTMPPEARFWLEAILFFAIIFGLPTLVVVWLIRQLNKNVK